MVVNLVELKLSKMSIIKIKDFMKKLKLRKDTMEDYELQRIYKSPINPRDSKINSDKGFVNMDSGEKGGTHWICFYIKNNKRFYFESLGEQAD